MKNYRLGGFEIFEFEEATSTNTLAESLPHEILKDKSVVLTDKQTQGKGQVGNKWESEPGQNISMTVVLRPQRLDAGQQFAISMIVALGVCDFVSRYVKDCSVKWPNDVYAGNRKITGILIEHSIAGMYVARSLCGIGVNINQKKFISDAPNPVSLVQLTGREMPLQEALEGLLECIGKRYEQLGDDELLERDFLRHLYRKDGVYDWRDENGLFRAEIQGIDEYGQLVLKDTGGMQRVYGFKEVKYL